MIGLDGSQPTSSLRTSQLELTGIAISTLSASLFHHLCVTRLFGHLARSSRRMFVVEFLCLVLPPLLIHTILSDHVLPVAFLFSNLCVLISRFASTCRSRRTSILRDFKVMILINTAVVIAAVDTRIFPRRFEKTRTYGFSPMDLATGFFVAVHALGLLRSDLLKSGVKDPGQEGKAVKFGYMNDEEREQDSRWELKKMPKFTPFLAIGLARTTFVSISGYYQDPIEYGTHWNFFLTLAIIQMVVSGSRVLSPDRPLIGPLFGFAIGSLYLLFLSTTKLESYVLSLDPNRSGLVHANREGLCSTLGYLFIFGWTYLIGYFLTPHELWTDGPSTQKSKTAIQLALIFLGHLALYVSALCVKGEPSRRAANLSYVLHVLTVTNLLPLFGFVYQRCIGRTKITSSPSEEGESLHSSISRHGGLFFLAANLLTGFLNYSRDVFGLNTPVREFGSLLIYAFVLCLGVWKLKLKQTKPKDQ